jgi:hypothetical protein
MFDNLTTSFCQVPFIYMIIIGGNTFVCQGCIFYSIVYTSICIGTNSFYLFKSMWIKH